MSQPAPTAGTRYHHQRRSPHSRPPGRDPRHTASMAVALWVLGDTEAEVAAELVRLRLLPAGRLLPCTGRARFMQRARATEVEPESAEQ